MTNALAFLAAHWDDILAAVTLIMSAIVGIAHGLVWLSDIAFRLTLLTDTQKDDRLAHRLQQFAVRAARGADWLASQHARLMPQRTPGIERVESER